MKRSMYLLVITALVLGLAVPALAQSALVTCLCGGGGGAYTYQYGISATGGNIWEFEVGTNDGNISNYTNIIMPFGWSFSITGAGRADSVYSPHGSYATADGPCPGSATFTADPGYEVSSGTFGFTNPFAPRNVGWEVDGWYGQYNSWYQMENWEQPVGQGLGPVHGVGFVPEPGSILALGSGLFALAGTFVRRRR